MKKLYYRFALALSLIVISPFWEKSLAATPSAATPSAVTPPAATPPVATKKCFIDSTTETPSAESAESVRLYYLRKATEMTDLLGQIFNSCTDKPVFIGQDESVIVLYGSPKQREDLKRIIAILDLPRERVNLAMWGILISSKNPRKLAEVMRQVNQEIAQTQRLLRETYEQLEDLAKEIAINENFARLFENDLGYQGALENDRSLSMTDILLRLNAAEDPVDNYNAAFEGICKHFYQKQEYKPYIEALNNKNALNTIQKRPFENFFRAVLNQQINNTQSNPNLPQSCEADIVNSSNKEKVLEGNLLRHRAILEFSLQYADRVNNPTDFVPQSLQATAENLNSLFNPVVDAINRDVEELFIEPTLKNIQRIVKKTGGVEYAEVGKTSVAGLNGIQSKVTSNSLNAFEETKPLRLDELLVNASDSNSKIGELLPGAGLQVGASSVPITSVVSLISALGKDRTEWRELASGVSLDITPSVLRNSSSAELKIVFSTGIEDPPNAGKPPQDNLRPLSRIKHNKVDTSVYVNTLDLFALSTFNSQTTIDGGRTYIPIVGTVWQGIFGDIPVLGNLFSWKNAPKNVQHQSVVLTNTFIVPTAMGLAPLYEQNRQIQKRNFDFDRLREEVNSYLSCRKSNIKQEIGLFPFKKSLECV